MTRPRKLAYIPGWVHAYVAGWLCEVIGEARTSRAMGWTIAQVRHVVAGDERLRPDERDRLMVVFGAVCADVAIVGDTTEEGGA